mmetsp:Transcript_7776/g.11523  ORF Transcript_7776/g.11523 Transcript_7776/m.11523 type:complete len:208 (+) Transcript_7776:1046-1669(+)
MGILDQIPLLGEHLAPTILVETPSRVQGMEETEGVATTTTLFQDGPRLSMALVQTLTRTHIVLGHVIITAEVTHGATMMIANATNQATTTEDRGNHQETPTGDHATFRRDPIKTPGTAVLTIVATPGPVTRMFIRVTAVGNMVRAAVEAVVIPTKKTTAIGKTAGVAIRTTMAAPHRAEAVALVDPVLVLGIRPGFSSRNPGLIVTR